jgi:hypothetical protein
MTEPNDAELPLTNAVVVLSGKDGNALSILGRVQGAILMSNHPELAQQFIDDAIASDFDNLLVTSMRYVDVQ